MHRNSQRRLSERALCIKELENILRKTLDYYAISSLLCGSEYWTILLQMKKILKVTTVILINFGTITDTTCEK